MDTSSQVISHVHELVTRAGGVSTGEERPPIFKAIGIALAVGSGAFIGTSFVLKKVGLLKANEKYNEVAGEGYGYLKNLYWWAGMILMIIGEGLNFAAYAFTDAILVTPLGALSVVITTILSAIFLKERLSVIGKVACFLCIVGSVVIVMNAPQSSAVANIQQMQKFVIHPLFLSYAGTVIIGSAIVALWLGPKYGNKNMLVYISICSWIGGLSVVATQGLGAAIIAQAQGTPQFNQWFLYVLLVFVIATLLTEIVYLNKALNIFNAAMVTPTYYVYFTSTTIISSAILFRGFKGTPTSIITVVNGFLTICSGVVLLQLSKSAKDVPDAAVFSGDLDQIHTIAEQAQPETEPKADAIRGTAAIIRRLSAAREKMELEELRRLREEKLQESLAPPSETGAPQYEWDGIRRRRTTTFGPRSMTAPSPTPTHLAPPTPHPPLGWSRFPTEEELAQANRPVSPALSSLVGSIRSRARSVLLPGHPDFREQAPHKVQSPMHPVQLTSVAVAGAKPPSIPEYDSDGNGEGSGQGLSYSKRRVQTAGACSRNVSGGSDAGSGRLPPGSPGQSGRRQFSFQNMFKRFHAHEHGGDGAVESGQWFAARGRATPRGYSSPQLKGATEEEMLGLVKNDGNTKRVPAVRVYEYNDDDDDSTEYIDDKKTRYGRGITHGYSQSPPRGEGSEKDEKEKEREELEAYERHRRRFRRNQIESSSDEDEWPSQQPRHEGPGPGFI